jgi:hypothetical protein
MEAIRWPGVGRAKEMRDAAVDAAKLEVRNSHGCDVRVGGTGVQRQIIPAEAEASAA